MGDDSPLITLTTDFGYQDYYVSAMKAQILSVGRNLHLIDISHAIPPQDIMAGAWVIRNAAYLFPKGSIHVCVIDPGVGGCRKPVLIESEGHFFIGPDNGLFSLVTSNREFTAWQITNRRFMNAAVSNTFHGRDVFAPAAAHLASGAAPAEFGPELDEIVTYRWADPIHDSEGIQGWILHIDHYGNLITNIPAELIEPHRDESVKIYAGTTILRGINSTYTDVETGEPVALIGSSGMLEISVNQGRAEELLNIRKGAAVSVLFRK